MEKIMISAKKLTGIALATAAAGLFAATSIAPAFAAKHEGKVQCMGANGCKGKGECATSSNACKGQNACKGKGMNMMSAKDCKDKGGKMMEDKK
jgi:hypothetical protein